MTAPIRTAIPILIVLALGLAACGGEPPPPTSSRPISFESLDGVTLEGRLFGPERSSAGIVLAHMLPADQTSWFGFADRLSRRGYKVLTFNFRGFCPGGEGGCSDGERAIGATWQDVVAGIALLRAEGVQRIGLVGASMGGTASLVAASREEAQAVDAVVTLSAPTAIEGLDANADVVGQVGGAKLFIAGHEDTGAAQAVDAFYAESLQPKRPLILTTGDHGTDILTGNQAGIASTEILAWLERYVPVSPGG